MLSHQDARRVLIGAWKNVTGKEPSRKELQWAQGQAMAESHYGADARVPNNWGSIQCTHGPPCVEGECAVLGDSHADGGKYQWCYRIYPTPEAGAEAFVRLITIKRPSVWALYDGGDCRAIATAMRKSGYFELSAEKYAERVYANATTIAKALGEPLELYMGGSVPLQPKAPYTVASGIAVGVTLMLAYYLTRKA